MYGEEEATLIGAGNSSNITAPLILGGYQAEFGIGELDDNLNEQELSIHSNYHVLYYHVPTDMPGGFYNVSISVQNRMDQGSESTGVAKMFENDRWYTYPYYRWYLFQSTVTGTSYSQCIFPSIGTVFPAVGSVAGGTLITIEGTGFSNNANELEVFVGGFPCIIQSAEINTITCLTSSRYSQDTINEVMDYSYVMNYTNGSSETDVFNWRRLTADHVAVGSPRRAGSPGWWFRFWNRDDHYAGRVGDLDYLKMSFPWHHSMFFSLYNTHGSDWHDQMDFATWHDDFTVDAGSIFTAPYTGYYTFFVASDDRGYLYASHEGMEVNEFQLAYDYYHSNHLFHRDSGTQISIPVPLSQGEKLYLRYRNVCRAFVV